MRCPLCNTDTVRGDTDLIKDSMVTDYHCAKGHLIQIIKPQNWLTVLILEPDGMELYQLRFENNQVSKVIDWDTGLETDLEGSGVTRHSTYDDRLCPNCLGYLDYCQPTCMYKKEA